MTALPAPGFLLALLLAAVTGAASGYLGWRWLLYEPPPEPQFIQLIPDKPLPPPPSLLGQPAPLFELPDIEGDPRASSEWRGKVVVLNFWATWCAPCREEIPLLTRIQQQFGDRGLQVVGLAMDKTAAVRQFAAELAIDFPLLVGEEPVMKLTRSYGNRIGALPYTAVVDRAGNIAYLKAGIISDEVLRSVLTGLL